MVVLLKKPPIYPAFYNHLYRLFLVLFGIDLGNDR
jgi:hypothetical protein